METKHTPGPWEYGPLAGGHEFGVYDATGKSIALIRNFDKGNARLIAAATDLLTALQRILNAHDSRNNGAFMGEAVLCPAFAEQARDAIAKATVE